MSGETETAASLKDQGRVKSRKPDKSKARVIRFRQRKKQEKMAFVAKGTPTLASLWSRHEPEIPLSDKVVEDCAIEDSESFLTEKEGSELEMSEHDPSWSLSGESESDENDSDNLSEGEDENLPTRHRLDMNHNVLKENTAELEAIVRSKDHQDLSFQTGTAISVSCFTCGLLCTHAVRLSPC